MARAGDVLEVSARPSGKNAQADYVSAGQLRAALNEHAAIAAAIEAEDPAAAREAMKQHLEHHRRAARGSSQSDSQNFSPRKTTPRTEDDNHDHASRSAPRPLGQRDHRDRRDRPPALNRREASALASAFRRATRWRSPPVEEGAPIRKFGQIIGFASRPIAAGEWVHEHNCASQRIRARLSFWRGHAPREHPAR